MSISIKHLKHTEIDKSKWDWNIRNAVNGNIYAWSWYLDAVAPEWEALVSEDYQHVMPLPWRKKWGFKYLYRPLLNQQLGVFSIDLPSVELVKQFILKLPAGFRLIEYCVNKYNRVQNQDWVGSLHHSYELDLAADYEQLASSFNQNTKRNLKKAVEEKLEVEPNLDAESFIKLMISDSSPGSQILTHTKNFPTFLRLLKAFKDTNTGRIIGVKNEDQQLIAAALFGTSHNKWYYLAPVNTEEGKDKRANFLIINHLIKETSGQAVTLDFEGSDISGVARFYAGFGAQPYTYTFLRINRLPWMLKFLKA